jgi:hypothetical protein
MRGAPHTAGVPSLPATHQKRDTKKGPRRQEAGMATPLPNSAHGDQLISAKASRYRAVFERPSYVTRWRWTGWLGRQDSNLGIRQFAYRWLQCCRQIVLPPAATSAHHLQPLFASHDRGRPNRVCFLMQRFESCAPTSQSGLHRAKGEVHRASGVQARKSRSQLAQQQAPI